MAAVALSGAAGAAIALRRHRHLVRGRGCRRAVDVAAGGGLRPHPALQDVRDLDGMRTFARDNAALGFTGQVLIHPTHADIANEEYGLSNDRVDYYRRLIAAFEAGERAGHGAVSFEGEHIDLAHANNAREQLRRAGLSVVQTAE